MKIRKKFSPFLVIFFLFAASFQSPVYATQCTAHGAVQDSSCTPGAVLPVTAAQVCVSGYSKSVRNVSTSTKNAVFVEYGIMSHSTGSYEVDHLISLELGGSNDLKNLWPEASSPTPGFHQKDVVENYLHQQVCSGKISLATAQHEISTNWLAVYTHIGGKTSSVPVKGSTIKSPKTSIQITKAKPTQSTTAPAVKKSVSNICHANGTKYYDQTKTFTAYATIKACLASGGKMPK